MRRLTAIAVPLAALGMAHVASAAVIIGTTAPTTNVIDSNPTGGIDSAIIDEASNANHARGNLFSLGASNVDDWQITSITIQKSNTQVYDSDTLTLRIYEGTEAQWDTGTGHETAVDGSNYYVGTTVTPLYTETFTLNGTFTDNYYVTFELATPLTVNENSDFGFFFTYEQVDGTQDRFRYREGNSGGRISITTTDHGVSTREFEYYVQGVPEPGSLALLGLAAFGLTARRRR